ncbi:dynein light chain, putative [Leishmania tarentolae]|uniref:Dynein light chain, putative n=1 Tax=Leishmania tarentolae TaxID=5689 RepID=A0A640KDF3_LEITA|nr:dynein light chain, putative [Leishmania tarentolae]
MNPRDSGRTSPRKHLNFLHFFRKAVYIKRSVLNRILEALEDNNSNETPVEHVHQMLHLVGDLKPESLSNNAVPRRSKLLVHLLLHVLGSHLVAILVLLQCVDYNLFAVDSHLLGHIARLFQRVVKRLSVATDIFEIARPFRLFDFSIHCLREKYKCKTLF